MIAVRSAATAAVYGGAAGGTAFPRRPGLPLLAAPRPTWRLADRQPGFGGDAHRVLPVELG